MKMRIQITRQLLTVFGGLLCLLIIVFQPSLAGASKLIHTIQVGSFEDIERAKRHYHIVIDRLNKEALNNLRIEKIGQFYSIRLGNFVNPVNANDLLRTVKHFFPSTILMSAYIKDERIIKLYSHTNALNKVKKNDSTSSGGISEIPKTLVPDEKKDAEDRLSYTIQIGSFTSLDRARNEFASTKRKLFDTKPNHLRIEKVGEYNTVRIGKFTKYVRAEKYLSSVKTHFVSAFIIKAYIRDKRIVRALRKDPAQQENGANIQEKPFSITSLDSSNNSGSAGNDQLEKYTVLPVSDKLKLHGTVIMDNVRLAIIEDSDSKQTGLYNLNDHVGGFIVSDILKNTVILNKKNTIVKILLWEGNKIALSNPEADFSEKIKEKSSQVKRRRIGGVRGERGIKARILRRKRQLNKTGTSTANP
jgi:hypothetical protein